jgi:hypothetical protein
MLDVFQWGAYLYRQLRPNLHSFFGIFCGLSAVWVWLCVPETRQVALEDMVISVFAKLIQDHVFGDTEGERENIHRRELLERIASAE